MAVRATGRHHHAVGERTLTFQVDEDDLGRLLIVEALENQGFEGGAAIALLGGRGLGGSGPLGGGRGVAAQRRLLGKA
jgi:hypothetical protein